MKEYLALARNLKLPLDAVTQTFGWIGQKGSGKTYFAGKFVEELYAVGAPFVVIDPVGNWGQGLRLSADGKRPGLSVPVLGGLHADVPLLPTSGAVVARFVMDKGCSVVVDVSGFRTAPMRQFVADFCEELFHLAKRVKRPTMVIFEEAQVFAPQHPNHKAAHRMLDAVVPIVRLGRNFGLGSAMITQRPQSVSKEVLNQVECLFIGKLNGRHERKAIDDWIVQNVSGEDVKDLVRQLPSLQTGEMMLWSPSWLGVFKQVRCGKKKTFDASATPKLGHKHRVVTQLPKVDLTALEESLGAAVEEAQRDDPVYLRQQIDALKQQLQEQESPEPEVPAVSAQELETLANCLVAAQQVSDTLGNMIQVLGAALKRIEEPQTIKRRPRQEANASSPDRCPRRPSQKNVKAP
ncbi:MAG: ATP-binding protein, partial [Alphaproteobacteria bacterium]